MFHAKKLPGIWTAARIYVTISTLADGRRRALCAFTGSQPVSYGSYASCSLECALTASGQIPFRHAIPSRHILPPVRAGAFPARLPSMPSAGTLLWNRPMRQRPWAMETLCSSPARPCAGARHVRAAALSSRPCPKAPFPRVEHLPAGPIPLWGSMRSPATLSS